MVSEPLNPDNPLEAPIEGRPAMTDAREVIAGEILPYLKRMSDAPEVIEKIMVALSNHPEQVWRLLKTVQGNNIHVKAATEAVMNDPGVWMRIGELTKIVERSGCLHGSKLETHSTCDRGISVYRLI